MLHWVKPILVLILLYLYGHVKPIVHCIVKPLRLI